MSYYQDLKLAHAIKKFIYSHYRLSGAYRGRTRHKLFPKQLAVCIVEHKTKDLTLDRIGQLFGYKDHCMVIHCRNRLDALVDSEIEIKEEVARVYRLMNEKIFLTLTIQ